MVGKKGLCVSESNDYVSVRAESVARGVSGSMYTWGPHMCCVFRTNSAAKSGDTTCHIPQFN